MLRTIRVTWRLLAGLAGPAAAAVSWSKLVTMRRGGLLLILVGCGFHSNSDSNPPPIDDAAPDTSSVPPDASGPLPDAIPPDATRSTFCDSITGLVACYEFEGNAKDGSGNQLDATTTPDIVFMPGEVGQAMLVGTSSGVTVNANILFDVIARLTVEAWIWPSALPGTGVSDILDVDNEYALSLRSNGTLLCDIHGLGQIATSRTVPVGQWTHVACTYNGAAGIVYINGSVAGTHNGSGAISTGTNGMALAGNFPSGSQLIGLIDQLRLLNVARSAAEICADAGKTSCP